MQNNNTYNVVIIDDSEIDLELLAHIVSEIPNVTVFKFQSGKEAVRFLSTNNTHVVDLVLCDYEMPKVNGLDVLMKFRAKNISVPFIFISAYVNIQLVNICKSEGATGFVVKPYITHKLQAKIEKAMNYKYRLQA
jgi:CheY-like chemotaxis protein